MKNNLTNKDKRLLLIMFLFVIVVGIGYWGIYPQIKAFSRLGNEIDNEEIKKSVNEQKVANLVFVETQCDEYEASMAENKQKFFDIMSEADIDLLLTGKAISHKLESFNLNINIPDTPSDRKAYRYSELYNEQLRRESERSYEETTTSSAEADIEELYGKSKNKDSKDTEPISETVDVFGDIDKVGVNNDIYAAKVTMTLGGSRSDLEAFLKELMDSDKEILITSFSWGKYRVQRLKESTPIADESMAALAPDYYEIVEMDSLTITMELYMCEKD